MAKKMVYFNTTKQIETITIHYNDKLDGTFVDDVVRYIKEVSKKMSKINLKAPKNFDNIQVFVYPSKQLFNNIFGGEIEKRFYRGKHSLEDFYVVKDSEGNIHIVSPRGMAPEKAEALKKILVMKVLGEYMEEKEKTSAERLLKEAMKPKEQEKEEMLDEPELEEEEPVELDEEPEEELDEIEELETDEPEEEELEVNDEQEEELTEEEVEEIIETELVLEQIDEQAEQETETVHIESNEQAAASKEEKPKSTKSETQEWLSAGWLAYVTGTLKREKDIKRFADNISKNGVKKLGQLSNSKWYESYNYSKEYACAIVEYIVKTYGYNKFAEFYENPKDIKGIFGVPKFIFEGQLKAYIKEKYAVDKTTLNVVQDMSLEKDIYQKEADPEVERKDEINEITEIHFVKSGGVDMLSDKEVQVPEIKER